MNKFIATIIAVGQKERFDNFFLIQKNFLKIIIIKIFLKTFSLTFKEKFKLRREVVR
jgi:hypothetical protein